LNPLFPSARSEGTVIDSAIATNQGSEHVDVARMGILQRAEPAGAPSCVHLHSDRPSIKKAGTEKWL
jgi:hypothetical protein